MNTPAALTADNLRTRFGWRADRRPEPGFGHVLAAAAGSFLVFATSALVEEIKGDTSTLPGVLLTLALIAVAIVGGMQFTGPVRSAFVTILVISTPLLWFYVFLGDNEGGRGAERAIYLLTIAVYAVLAAILWTRGRGIMIGIFLFALTLYILWEVGGDSSSAVPFSDLSDQVGNAADAAPGGVNSGLLQGGDTTTEVSAVSLALGLLYLGAAWRFDRQRLMGLATPFIAIGAIFGILGAIALGAEESVIAGGLSAAAIGAVVGAIGGLGTHRRATTWFGVIFIKFGLVAVAADVADSSLGFAGLCLLFAIGLGVIALIAAKQFNEYIDGDEEGGQVTTTRPISI